MTREKAITELNTFKMGAKSELGENALDMAIKALEQEPCEMTELVKENDDLKMKIDRLRQELCDVKAIIHNAMFDYAGQDVTYGALAKVRNQINSLHSIKGGYE